MQRFPISSGWQLKQRDPSHTLTDDFAASDGWLPASAPGTVHQDLLAAGRIPDPFIGLNEQAVQWIGEQDWLYRCAFDLPPGFTAATTVLCCDGLDTFATVWLNGEQILVSDNMFVPQRVALGSQLRPGHNQLQILFESALRRGREREAAHGARRVWNGDPSRVYVRKAQYHYGWDWGPVLMVAGPWRAVYLETYDARIADLACLAEVADDLASARLPVEIAVETSGPTGGDDLSIHLEMYGPAGELLDTATTPVDAGAARHTFTVAAPQLWWPHGHGQQPLYRLVATLQKHNNGQRTTDHWQLRLGMRRLRLVQEPLADQPGMTFLFEVNNQPIFCGGANWIPADSFTPRITVDRYRALLQRAVDMNMVMLRVWGGGIYEADSFYDVCDELGLLVWQDFMFACGIYPAYPAFQASVRAEAEAQVRRLRQHPCIALWCGNNEDYQIAYSLGAYDPTFDGDFTTSAFPARAVYERLLPEVCATLDPSRLYWRGSPYQGANPDDPTIGDRHAWEVWKGADYHDYPKYAGRFVSEFGMASAPSMAALEIFAPPDERYPQSRTLDYHNKATGGPRRLAEYLTDNVRMPGDLDSYIYATQLVQAEALGAAIRGWRRHWGGPGRYAVAGALIWQLDDCWPVISWAIVDYTLRLKPACYVVRRELAALVVGLARSEDGALAWAVNGATTAVAGELEVRTWMLSGTQVAAERWSVTLAPNQATEIGAFGFDVGRALIFDARLLVNDKVVARAALWPEPFKYLALPDPAIQVERLDGETLRVHAARPAKGVLLSAEEGVEWSDNMLDLMPGDEQIIVARGLGDAEPQVRWLR